MNNSNNIVYNIEEMDLTEGNVDLTEGSVDLTKLSKPELLAKCEEMGIKKYKSKDKNKLIELINQKQITTQTIPLKKIEFILSKLDLNYFILKFVYKNFVPFKSFFLKIFY